jgi:branched-chain amino acid transport system permease protein
VWPIALKDDTMKSFFPSIANNPKAAYFSLAVLGLFLLFLPIVASQFGNGPVRLLAMAILYVMLALGLNIVVGYAGLLDLGYVAFYAVGAYVYALLSSPHLAENFEWIARVFPDGLHTSIWIILPLSAGIAALFGVILGAPTLRLRGDYLAIVTLGFGEIIRIFMNNLNSPINITNGPQGISKIDSISIGPIDFAKPYQLLGHTFSQTQLYYYLFLVLAVLIVIVNMRLQDSRIGRAWMAIREDEIAAKPLPWAPRLEAFQGPCLLRSKASFPRKVLY